MKREKVTDESLKAIVDVEIKQSMGEIGGELSHERARAMDYYLGQTVGKLEQTNPDRSSVVITTSRDTVEWLMPQLMRLFAQADSVVEFNPVGQEDEPAAKQETQAVNHIFWRENEGFLILYSWIKDALIQKNGIVKYWIEEVGEEGFEEYDGMTALAIEQMLATGEVEPIEQEISDTESLDGQPLFHVKFRRLPKKRLIIEVLPPEEFLISTDANSLDIQTRPPRFCGHHTAKTENEFKSMGFTDEEIEELGRGDERWHEIGEEWQARYHLADEKHFLFGNPPHDSLRKISIIEGYMNIDMDGDGYAELIRFYRGGDHISWEEVDHRPFASLTPNILSHKFFGLSINDMVKDIQEISTATMRNVLDNMYQVNNTRPIVNNRVDTDSLLTSRPGAPIYVDDSAPVGDACIPFAPPPVWKDGLQVLEYMDSIRKDRTGIGDETMGLDPSTLASANTGVVLQAMEASQAKVELIARILAETGLKWLFRGIHELCRKNYDQPLRYELRGEYIQVMPSEWRKRTNLTVNVGTATGNRQQNLFGLMQVAQLQQAMVQGGLMGKTVLPSNIYQTGKSIADNLGLWGDKFFLNPKLLLDPQVQEIIKMQLPPPDQPDPQIAAIQATAEAEQMKAEVSREKNQADAMLKNKELEIKQAEIASEVELKTIEKAIMVEVEGAKKEREEYKLLMEQYIKQRDQDAKIYAEEIKLESAKRDQDTKMVIEEVKAETETLKTIADNSTKILESMFKLQAEKEKIAVDIASIEQGKMNMSSQISDAMKSGVEPLIKKAQEDGQVAQQRIGGLENQLANITEAFMQQLELIQQQISTKADVQSGPKDVVYDDDDRIIGVGSKKISYDEKGRISRIE